MSILIVDDNEIIRILIEKMLRANQYSTFLAGSGTEALKILETSSDIRLVIADILMPEMSGLELLKRMKQSPVLKDIPVILCSVLADIENVRQGAILGCYSYLVKPLQRDLLLQKVAQALAATRPIVSSLRSIQTKYGLDARTCNDVVHAFLTVMKSDLEVLEANQKRPDASVPHLHLKQLGEAASILGAEQLEARIGDVLVAMETKSDANSQLLRLMRDMQVLITKIEPQIAAGKTAD